MAVHPPSSLIGTLRLLDLHGERREFKKKMTHPRTAAGIEKVRKRFCTRSTIENSEEKTLVFLLFSFTAAAGQNS